MISVIIPVGPGRDAREALSSLPGAGLGKDDEVVVIGDGHEVEIPPELERLNIRSESLPTEKGANAVRNHGAQVAKGDFLCFLDDDDAYAENGLSVVANIIEKDERVGAWALHWRYLSGRFSFSFLFPGVITPKNLRKRNRAGGASSMVVRKTVFEQAGGFDESMPSMQDWDLWLRLSRRTRIKRIPQNLVVYNDIGVDRISTNRNARISGLSLLLQKNESHWSSSVRAFHKARINSIIFASGSGKWRQIFHLKAPIASAYFSLIALFSR